MTADCSADLMVHSQAVPKADATAATSAAAKAAWRAGCWAAPWDRLLVEMRAAVKAGSKADRTDHSQADTWAAWMADSMVVWTAAASVALTADQWDWLGRLTAKQPSIQVKIAQASSLLSLLVAGSNTGGGILVPGKR